MKKETATRIKAIREDLGMTQAELAKEIGVGRLTVSQWEIGFRRPSLLAMKAIEMLKELLKGSNFIEMLEREAKETFDRFNKQYFNGELKEGYKIAFNRHMKTTEGTAIPHKRIIFLSMGELGRTGWKGVEETIKHEMVHCWLYEKGRSWGHGHEFKAKLKEITRVD